MCIDCGCSKENNNIAIATHQHKIEINRGILSKNDRLAEQNRNLFAEQKLLVVNLLSSPGSGKTALIEQLLQSTGEELNIGVIVGDLATDNDARRLQNKGAPAIQITTGNACHLEAEMVAQAAKQLDLVSLELLIIENVGNLVCPAAYDLGEDLRIVLLSVTEGEDKPLKYPLMFKSAQIVVINKIDLAEAVEFDLDRAIANIYKTAPQAKIFQTSAKTGRGMDSLLSYLSSSLEVKTLSQTNQN